MYFFFEVNPEALCYLRLSVMLVRIFATMGTEVKIQPWHLHLTLSCCGFGSSSANEFVTIAAGSGTGTVLSFHCHWQGGCSLTLTLLPGRLTMQTLLLVTPHLLPGPLGPAK